MANELTTDDELTTTVDGEAEDPIDTVEGAVIGAAQADDDEADPIAPPVAAEPALEPPVIQTLPPADPPRHGLVGPS